MWAVQDSRVTNKHFEYYGTCFPEEIQFAEEQPITSKTKSSPCVSRLPDMLWGKSLCNRVREKFASLQVLKWVLGVLMMLG